MSKWNCRLCYIADNTNLMDTDAFLNHLADTHNAPKIKDILNTIEMYGGPWTIEQFREALK